MWNVVIAVHTENFRSNTNIHFVTQRMPEKPSQHDIEEIELGYRGRTGHGRRYAVVTNVFHLDD